MDSEQSVMEKMLLSCTPKYSNIEEEQNFDRLNLLQDKNQSYEVYGKNTKEWQIRSMKNATSSENITIRLRRLRWETSLLPLLLAHILSTCVGANYVRNFTGRNKK